MLGFQWLLVAAAALRLVLVVWSSLQDKYFEVPYTDVDYYVFLDAAQCLLNGGSPYERPTYRYTPALAELVSPSVWLFSGFGKELFGAADILVGWLIYRGVRRTVEDDRQARLAAALWLFNPVTFVVSTRGNAEALLAAVVLLAFDFMQRDKTGLAGILLGLATHLKVYPVIYTWLFFWHISCKPYTLRLHASIPDAIQRAISVVATLSFWKLAVAFVVTFTALTAFYYARFGEEFLHHTYYYHFGRVDYKHNFSLYFLPLYLNHDTWVESLLSKFAFFPQAVTVALLGYRLRDRLFVGGFAQTMAFVAFNKVSTSQYFLWYLPFVPFVVAQSTLTRLQLAVAAAAWLGGQAFWLYWAFLLEIKGQDQFIWVWAASCLWLCIQVGLLVILCRNIRPLSQGSGGKAKIQ